MIVHLGGIVELHLHLEFRQGFEALDKAEGIVVEDTAAVEQVLGIEDGLQLLHHLIGLLAPFVFHERRHVATRAVLGFQRAVVFLHDQTGHVAHHILILLHVLLGLETLVQDEVVIALEGVAVDAGIGIAVVGNHLLQLHGCLRQVFQREGDVFNQAGGADGTHAAHRREDTRTDGPVLSIDLRVFRELGRYVEIEMGKAFRNGGNLGEQLLVGDGLRLGEHGR